MEGSSNTCLQTHTCRHTHITHLYTHTLMTTSTSLIHQSVWQKLLGNRLRKQGTWHVERESNQLLRHPSAYLCRQHRQPCTYRTEPKKRTDWKSSRIRVNILLIIGLIGNATYYIRLEWIKYQRLTLNGCLNTGSVWINIIRLQKWTRRINVSCCKRI